MLIKLSIIIFLLIQVSLARTQAVRLGSPTLVGSGCPAHLVSVALTPDASLISFLFSGFTLTHSAGGPLVARLLMSCKVQIPVEMPPGYAMNLMKLNYRGFYSLPDKQTNFSLATSGLRVIMGRGAILGPAPQITRAHGPTTSGYEIIHTLTRQFRTQCGKPFVLEFTIDMSLTGAQLGRGMTPIKGGVMASLDSLDIDGNSTGAGAYLGVELSPCQ